MSSFKGRAAVRPRCDNLIRKETLVLYACEERRIFYGAVLSTEETNRWRERLQLVVDPFAPKSSIRAKAIMKELRDAFLEEKGEFRNAIKNVSAQDIAGRSYAEVYVVLAANEPSVARSKKRRSV